MIVPETFPPLGRKSLTKVTASEAGIAVLTLPDQGDYNTKLKHFHFQFLALTRLFLGPRVAAPEVGPTVGAAVEQAVQ